jgi:hypothetical protein
VALTLPLLVVLAAVIIDVAVVASQQVAVVDAARAAARAAATAVDADPGAAATAATGAAPALAGDRMQVSVSESADMVTAEVRFRTRPAAVLVGRFLPSLELKATESFAREPDGSS